MAWAALAVGGSLVILPSSAALSHLGAAPTASARARQHRHGHLVVGHRPRSARVALQWLVPVSATAFGPSGLASGDNNQLAPLAIDSSQLTAWKSDWYRSAAFGGLQSGTGLLVDLGRPVRLATVVIRLGWPRGASLRVIAELRPHPPTSRGVAQVTDAGGLVRLRPPRPVLTRYLVIWFTLLPPDGTGTFQASVYDIGVYVVKTSHTITGRG